MSSDSLIFPSCPNRNRGLIHESLNKLSNPAESGSIWESHSSTGIREWLFIAHSVWMRLQLLDAQCNLPPQISMGIVSYVSKGFWGGLKLDLNHLPWSSYRRTANPVKYSGHPFPSCHSCATNSDLRGQCTQLPQPKSFDMHRHLWVPGEAFKASSRLGAWNRHSEMTFMHCFFLARNNTRQGEMWLSNSQAPWSYGTNCLPTWSALLKNKTSWRKWTPNRHPFP